MGAWCVVARAHAFKAAVGRSGFTCSYRALKAVRAKPFAAARRNRPVGTQRREQHVSGQPAAEVSAQTTDRSACAYKLYLGGTSVVRGKAERLKNREACKAGNEAVEDVVSSGINS